MFKIIIYLTLIFTPLLLSAKDLDEQIQDVKMHLKDKNIKDQNLILGAQPDEPGAAERFPEFQVFIDDSESEDPRLLSLNLSDLDSLTLVADSFENQFKMIVMDDLVFWSVNFSLEHLRQIKRMLAPQGSFVFAPAPHPYFGSTSGQDEKIDVQKGSVEDYLNLLTAKLDENTRQGIMVNDYWSAENVMEADEEEVEKTIRIIRERFPLESFEGIPTQRELSAFLREKQLPLTIRLSDLKSDEKLGEKIDSTLSNPRYSNSDRDDFFKKVREKFPVELFEKMVEDDEVFDFFRSQNLPLLHAATVGDDSSLRRQIGLYLSHQKWREQLPKDIFRRYVIEKNIKPLLEQVFGEANVKVRDDDYLPLIKAHPEKFIGPFTVIYANKGME